MVIVFEILKLFFFCFVVAMSGLVHDVEVYWLYFTSLTGNNIWKYFLKYEWCLLTQVSLIFQEKNTDIVRARSDDQSFFCQILCQSCRPYNIRGSSNKF